MNKGTVNVTSTESFPNTKAKKLKPGDEIFVGSKKVTVSENSKNAFEDRVIHFLSDAGPIRRSRTGGTLIVSKDYLFHVTRTTRTSTPKK